MRISVKREDKGVVSNHLHDNLKLGNTVKLTHPAGDFVLRKNAKPLVLLTAGVGITPAISMLNAEIVSGRKIRFIHAAIDSKVHAFKTHVNQLAESFSNVLPFYIYSNPKIDCKSDAIGLINKDILESQLSGDRDVELYFLGPKPFMKSALKIAVDLGVPSNQIHYEFFGPSEDLTA